MVDLLVNLFIDYPLLLLFFVATFGYALGKITIKGVRLGVAATLFVGLAIGAFDERITLPPIITSLGLILFVYALGIASGSTFFASFRKNGLRDSLMVIGILSLGAVLVIGVYYLIDLSPSVAAGMYTGVFTNTPALAGVTQFLETTNSGEYRNLAGLPAVGYSIAYPMGVLGPILAIVFWQKRYKINYVRDAKKAKHIVAAGTEINNETIKITNLEYCGVPIKQLVHQHDWGVIFSRLKRNGEVILIRDTSTVFELGDVVTVIGAPETLRPVARELGELLDEELDLDRRVLDFRRVFVSNKKLIGKKLSELRIPQRHGALITRVRRGDIEMLAHKNFVLEYGDRVRFIAPHEKLLSVSKFFGDSYRSISEFHMFSIGLGICIGLLVGMIPFHLPGGVVFRLGDAGGPLLVGLILGALRRTGPVVWGISYTANLTLREFGLILMLAGIGVRSGQTFIDALGDGRGIPLLLTGAVISFCIPFIFIPFAYKKLKMPFAVITGMVSAIHTQPAAHAFSTQQSNNDLPNHGYAQVFPIATITKLILAQLILLVLLG